MKCHQVDFLFPSFPVPESHTVRERTIIEIITELQIRFMSFLLQHRRQHLRKISLHAIPRQVDSGIILQIPVDTRGNADIVVTAYHDFIPLLIQFKEILFPLQTLYDKFTGRPFINTFQQAGNGRSVKGNSQKEKTDQT